MSFRPDDVPKGEIALQEVDTTKDALKWLDPPTSTLRAKTSKFRDSNGLTRGETALPESAPLIYPDTGYAEIGNREEEDNEAKTTTYSKRRVVQTYLDKRAQAKYVSGVIGESGWHGCYGYQLTDFCLGVQSSRVGISSRETAAVRFQIW